MGMSHTCTISLPGWVGDWTASWAGGLASSEEGMAFAIATASENVARGSGGPFAAAVIDKGQGQLISVGVNVVTASGLSIAHAEMVAISLAQHRLGDWNLAKQGNFCLVTTCEPCAMCFGAVPWSGVRSLVCGARKSDAETAGFDEGDKPRDWVESLRKRGIDVELDVLREQAARIFRQYRETGGVVYNAGPQEQQ